MTAEHPVYLLDITTGLTRKLIEFLEAVQRRLGRPPELGKIFPWANDFDFSRIRVSVQLSEKLPELSTALETEHERAAGRWQDQDNDSNARYQWRSADEYEKKRGFAPARNWEEVRGDILKPNQLRAIVLGDPGFGKSWLLFHEGRELAQIGINRLRAGEVGTEGVIIPVFARLADLARMSGPFMERLKKALALDSELPHLDYLWPLIAKKVCSGQALLLLDGWDEARVARSALQQTLENFVSDNQSCRLLLTSRFAGYRPIALAATRWDLVSLSPEQVKEFIGRFFKPANAAGERLGAKLEEHLRANFQIGQLGRIPLMLALLCRLFWQEGGKALPSRRVEIYERCLKGLTLEWKPKKSDQMGDEEATTLADLRLDFAAELSLKMFLNYDVIDPRSSRELKSLMLDGSDDPQAALAVARRLDELIEDGILVKETPDSDGPLRFIHLTFQEYLAATALTNRANVRKGQGWDHSRIKTENKQVSIPELIDKKSWDGHWQEVITLVAGKLDDASPLLKLLHSRQADDLLRHRLCLAVLCFVELGPGRNQNLVDRIAEDLLALWWSEESLRDIDRYLGPAASASGTVVDHLLKKLGNGDQRVRFTAAYALGKTGQAAANHLEVIPSLLALLRDKDSYVRSRAAESLGQMGEAAAKHPDVLPSLLPWLRDEDFDIRSDAVHALGRIGEATANHSDVIPALVALLRDKDWNMRFSAVYALGRWGGSKHPDVIHAVVPLLRDKEWNMRFGAVYALGRMSKVAAEHPDVIPALISLLHDKVFEVRFGAVGALFEMSESAAKHADVTPALRPMLHDKEGYVRSIAAQTLGRMEDTASKNSDIIPCLLSLLRDKDSNLRSRAAYVLGQIREAAAKHPSVSPALVALLRDQEQNVRCSAAEALGEIGEAAANRPDVIPSLVALLRDDGWDVRASAAQACGQIGQAAAKDPEVLSSLVLLLRDKQHHVRYDAAKALAKLRVRVFEQEDGSLTWKTIEELSKL
jgi:HEAT repeat protein